MAIVLCNAVRGLFRDWRITGYFHLEARTLGQEVFNAASKKKWNRVCFGLLATMVSRSLCSQIAFEQDGRYS